MLLASVTSQATGMDLGTSADCFSRFASLRAIMTTRTPSRPRALAIPAPMPRDAPVTTALLPLRAEDAERFFIR
jgi:hypothetical protein